MPNYTSWKAYACVLLVSSFPLLLQLGLIWLGIPISLISGSLLVLCYAWLLPRYTVPFFTSGLHHIPEAIEQSLLLAHAPHFFAQPPASKFAEHMKNTPNNGMVRMRGLFHNHTSLLLTSPEALKEVLNDKPYDWVKPTPPRRFLERIVGFSLLTTEGHVHKQQRKSVTPAFHGSHIKNLMPLFWDKSKQMGDVLSRNLHQATSGSREGILNINDFAPRVTLDIMGVAGLGRDFNTLENDDDVIAKSFATITNTSDMTVIKYFVASVLLPPWLLQALPWSMNEIFARATKTLRDSCVELIEQKKISTVKEGDDHVDILSIMLRQAVPLTADEIRDQLLTFLAAGSDTTSNSLIWTMYVLATHPGAQERLRDEVSNYVKKSEVDGELDLAGLDALPLLNAVCNETIRVFPAAPITGRDAVKPTSILGVNIPTGTEIVMSPWVINRSPEIWGEDAEVWKPERWLEEGNALTGGSKNIYNFMTFLHGPRSCIGQGFARSELKFLVAATVRRFRWEMADKDEKIIPAGAVTIKPKHGLKVMMWDL